MTTLEGQQIYMQCLKDLDRSSQKIKPQPQVTFCLLRDFKLYSFEYSEFRINRNTMWPNVFTSVIFQHLKYIFIC